MDTPIYYPPPPTYDRPCTSDMAYGTGSSAGPTIGRVQLCSSAGRLSGRVHDRGGLERVVQFVRALRVLTGRAGHLASLPGADGVAMFEPAFLDYLAGLRLSLDVDAVPEGTVLFPRSRWCA